MDNVLLVNVGVCVFLQEAQNLTAVVKCFPYEIVYDVYCVTWCQECSNSYVVDDSGQQ